MAEPGQHSPGPGSAGLDCRDLAAARGRAGGRLRAVRRSALWPPFAETLREWVAAEAGAGRLLPWVPVAFGVGIAFYFAADHEPVLPVAALRRVALCVAAFLLRRQKLFPVAVMIAAVAAGFAAATWKTARIAPCRAGAADVIRCRCRALSRPATSASAPTVRAARHPMESAARAHVKLERVRLSVTKGHRARGRQLCRIEGAAAAAARAIAARQLRFRAATCISRASALPVS